MMDLWQVWPVVLLAVALIGWLFVLAERLSGTWAPRIVWRAYWIVLAATVAVFVLISPGESRRRSDHRAVFRYLIGRTGM